MVGNVCFTGIPHRKMSLLARNFLDRERSARQLCGAKQPRIPLDGHELNSDSLLPHLN
jgi:hypothetical protein